MRRLTRRLWLGEVFVLAVGLSSLAAAQKVKVEYNKSEDFNKYKTYSWIKREA